MKPVQWQGDGGDGPEDILRTMMLPDLLKLYVCGCDGLHFSCPQPVNSPSSAQSLVKSAKLTSVSWKLGCMFIM